MLGLETSLTPKGLRLPQFCIINIVYRLETSLTPKGLRPSHTAARLHSYAFRNFPDSKGIKTLSAAQVSTAQGLETSLTPKGLRLILNMSNYTNQFV